MVNATALWKDALFRTSLASLERFYMPEEGILSRRVVWDGTRLIRAEPSPQNTAQVAMALYALRRSGTSASLDPGRLLERLIVRYLPTATYQDIAFMLWADSIGDGRFLDTLWRAFHARLPIKVTHTMYLSWTLSALCHYFSVARDHKAVGQLAHRLYIKIARNQSTNTGLFYGSAARKGLLRRRQPVASLSSQSYTIYAFALYGKIFGESDAWARARRCADTLGRLQGKKGQWWWRYHVPKGAVVERFPVYAVNQDAAIPLALGELGRVLEEDQYEGAIAAGLSWLFGNNELGISLVDEEKGVIWRAIECRDGGLSLVREMYSYHPARCLFALCAALE